MMDSHLIVIIACVFLASLFSLLFINKFFRRKTFEEVIAEKKALTEKIYGKDRAAIKKPRKQITKKEFKKERKQKQRDQQKQTANVIEANSEDSDIHSETPQDNQLSSYDETTAIKTTTKEDLESESVRQIAQFNKNELDGNITNGSRRSSNIDKENISKLIKGNKKEKKLPGAQKSAIVSSNKHDKNDMIQMVNVTVKDDKHEMVNLSSNNVNNIEILKKSLNGKKEEKVPAINQMMGKKEKNGKKNLNNNDSRDKMQETFNNVEVNAVVSKREMLIESNVVIETMKEPNERPRQLSPKINQQTTNKSKHNNKKYKEFKDTAISSLDQLTDRDTVSVSLLMNILRRAELNRSEIQILIDYLLNRQQDMPTNHSEWSDDICQKLKRQLKDAENALIEEQNASIGIQAKLRELRAEINSERTTMNAAIKSYVEKLQVKDQDIEILEQKVKTLNDNLTLERQQFQTKLLYEKQSATQDLQAQVQLLQNDLTLKEKCVAELTCIVNASRQAVEESQQKNDVIQKQVQQIHALEQQRDELEQLSNNRIFELEKAKQMETELNETKIELRNLQNALETAKADANQSRLAAEAIRNDAALAHTQLKNIANKAQEQSKEQSDLQAAYEAIKLKLADKEIHLTNAKIMETQLQQQLITIETAAKEQSEKQLVLQKTVEMLSNQIDNYKKQLIEHEQLVKKQKAMEKLTDTLQAELREKEMKLSDYHQFLDQIQELQKLISILKEEVADKENQLQQVKQQVEAASIQEQQLIEQLNEQKSKNNEQQKLLVTTTSSSMQTISDSIHNRSDSTLEERRVRELFQRLYPDAVKACASTALSVSFDQWMEQVLAMHSKQQLQLYQHQLKMNSNHKSTQSSDSSYTLNSSATQNSYNGKESRSDSPSAMIMSTINAATASNNPEIQKSNDAILSTGSSDTEYETLLNENKLLRLRIEELTQLARKTDNIVTDLKHHVKEQDDHWRSVLQSKDDEITALRHPNGQQEDI